MATVRDELIELRNLRFHFRDWAGPADAPPLIALHGFTGHARTWDHMARALSRTRRVLALDQRGHGETEWAPADAYDYQEMVEDVAAFVQAMQLPQFDLLGLSMGGNVATHFAGRQPAGLNRLVIVDIGPEIPPDALRQMAADEQRADVFGSVDEAFARARQDNPVPPESHHRQRVRDNLMRTADGRWTYRYDRALRSPDIRRARPTVQEGWAAIGRISVPTLIVRGSESDLFPADVAQRMQVQIGDARLAEIAGAGHPVPLDKPDAFLEAVETFLKESG